jgi:hypothetical protein
MKACRYGARPSSRDDHGPPLGRVRPPPSGLRGLRRVAADQPGVTPRVRGLAKGVTVAWGVAIAIGVPLLAVLALVTLVGIPFGVALLLAAVPVLLVAYATSAWIVGRRVLRNRSTLPWAALLIGWGILRVLALIRVAGALVGLAATVVGLGALAVALWRAGRPGAPAARARGAGSGPSRTRRLTVADSISQSAGDATAVRVRGPTKGRRRRGVPAAAAQLPPAARADAVREQWS